MATTPTYNLPYQTLDDPPDGAALGQDLAEAVETEITRLDGVVGVISTANNWTAYTPAMQNIGSGAFSTQTGYWRRVGTKDVVFVAYFVVSTNGTGTGTASFQLPTNPDRSIRQCFHGERGDTGRLAILEAVSFAGGVDNWTDRIVTWGTTVTAANWAYVQGQDLDAGDIITFSGRYREA